MWYYFHNYSKNPHQAIGKPVITYWRCRNKSVNLKSVVLY
jgi:hypothetical protein